MKKMIALWIVALVFLSGCTVVRADRKTVTGIDGIQFEIEYPSVTREIYARDYGLSVDSADNRDALQAAIQFCKENPGTKLIIEPGRYLFDHAADIQINGVNDLLIEANGATFVFAQPNYFTISKSNRILFHNLQVEWDWDTFRIADLVEIMKNVPGDDGTYTTDIRFVQTQDVDTDYHFTAMIPYAADTWTPGNGAFPEVSLSGFVQNIEKISPDTLRVKHTYTGFLSGFYLSRQVVYDGTVFNIGGKSRDITMDGVHIYSTSGVGYYIHHNAGAIQVVNSSIRDNPADRHYISTTADGMQISDSSGEIYIDNCDFSFTGDDCINIHQTVQLFTGKTGPRSFIMDKSYIRHTPEVGQTLEFFDPWMLPVDFSADIADIQKQGTDTVITLDRDIPDEIEDGLLYVNRSFRSGPYVITNSSFHENRARGILAQAPDGLICHNTFYKNMGAAIHVTSDITSNSWREGADVRNILIENNVFEASNVSNWPSAQIKLAQYSGAEESGERTIRDIRIQNNVFKNFATEVLYVASTENLIFSGNIMDNSLLPEEDMKSFTGTVQIKRKNTAAIYQNTWIGHPFITDDDTAVPKRSDSVQVYENIYEKREHRKYFPVLAALCTKSGLEFI